MADPAGVFAAQVERLAEEAPALLRRVLRTGGRSADLFYEHTVHHRLALSRKEAVRRAGMPAQQRHLVCGAGIHVLGAEAQGYAASEDLSAPALRRLADAAATPLVGEASPRGALPSDWVRVAGPALPPDAPDAASEAERRALLEQAADAAYGLDARIGCVEVQYHDRVRRTFVAATEGRLVTTASVLVGLRVEVLLETAGRRVKAHAVEGGASGLGHFFAHPPEHTARVAVTRAQRLAEARPIRSGPMPVVIAAGWGGAWLHEAVGHLLEADVALSGASPLAGCLGRRVAPPGLTLIDDAALPGGRASTAFDDEGFPAGRTVLIEDGVLRGLLTDRRHAHRLACPRTGSARRQDYRYVSLPRMTNLLLLPGEAAPEDLLAEVRDGLFVAAVGQGQIRPGGGFSLEVVEGYRIEQGRLTAPVSGVRLEGAAPEVLTRVAGIGRDLQVDTARGLCAKAGQVVPVSVGMPTLLVDGIEVVGRVDGE